MLKETFIDLLSKYSANNNLANKLWNEIENNYTNKKRHYHTLQHLENLLKQLVEIKDELQNWDTVLFTLYYHDIIYDALNINNEKKSAELAEKRMKQMAVPVEIIKHCKEQILATKSHQPSTDSDTNYFTDADLSILGQPWEAYSCYYKNIRKKCHLYRSYL